MQSVLIVSATLAECQGLLKSNFIHVDGESFYADAFADFKADLLITGVGSIATTFYLTKMLSTSNYRFLLNIGLAGSFNKTVLLGMVVSVGCDQFADLGAEDHDDFIDIFDLGLLNPSERPFVNRKLIPIVSNNSSAIPDFSNTEPRNTKKGMAKSVKLDIVPNQLFGSNNKRLGSKASIR